MKNSDGVTKTHKYHGGSQGGAWGISLKLRLQPWEAVGEGRFIAWQRGSSSTYILNVDDSVQFNSGMADFGGLIRDSNGGFMCAFYGNIVYSNILHAEILALLQGIRLCWKEDLRNIIYYIDSINTIHMVHHGDVFTHHYENEITTIRNT